MKGVPAERNEKQYDCCPEVYIDITFTVSIQRRKLYYIFNLVVPCLMMSCPAISTLSLSLSLLALNLSCSRARTARLHDVLSVTACVQHAAGRRRKNHLRYVIGLLCFSL